MVNFNKKGVSFIVLVVTIIVSIILLSVVVLNIKNSNVMSESSETKFKANIKTYQDELADYISEQEFQNSGRYNDSLYADLKVVKYENTVLPNITIKDVISSITDSDLENFIVYNSEVMYTGSDTTEMMWASDLIKTKNLSTDSYARKSNLILNLDGYTAPESDVWKDLSATKCNMGSFTNYIYDEANKCYTFANGTGITDKSLSIGSNYTVEIVLSTSIYKYTTIGMNKTDNTSLLQLKLRVVNDYPYWNNGSSVNWSQHYNVKQALNKNTSFAISNNFSQNEGGIYINNEKNQLKVDNLNFSSLFFLGTGSESFSGNIYAIRIYNEALTDEELAINYELDKIRFGIN